MFSSVPPSPIPLFLLRPPLSQHRTTRLIIVGGALHCDAWTSLHRLYGVAERLILLVVGGGGVEREWGRERAEGAVPPPSPLPLLPSACWEWELEAGAELEGSTEGHNTLFSPLNPSVTCHMFVMNVERKTVERRKGGGRKWGKKEQLGEGFGLLFFSFFSPRLWQTRD